MNESDVEAARRARLLQLNAQAADRAELERRHGRVWTTRELAEEFVILGFAAPFAVVRRRIDGQVGSVEFQHDPRFFFNFEADKKPA